MDIKESLPSKAALDLLPQHLHGYVLLKGRPESDWDLAQELVDGELAGWWGTFENPRQRESSNGIYLTSRAVPLLKEMEAS